MASADQINETLVPRDAPRDWKLDPITNELVFPLSYVSGPEAVAQRLGIVLRMFRGEFFADRKAGTPYLENDFVDESQAILSERFDQPKAEASFRRVILGTIGVDSIRSLSVVFDHGTRGLDVQAQVVTVYGDTVDVRVSRILE